MEEEPVTIRIYPGDLRPVYFTSVLVFRTTQTLEVIRQALERLQIFEDKTLYELYEGEANKTKKNEWTKLSDSDCPVAIQEKWKHVYPANQEMRFYLRRKEHASLVLAEIVSQYISPEVNEGRIQDMCELEEFTEQDMLSNLKSRFSNKDIYTYVGSILISINPYYFYSIYNPKYASMYQGRELGSLPPHIFAIADSSYHTMLSERQNQSVIISGESGAGKTESTKFLLHHLMSLSAKMDESHSLELITLGTGPVLEAFGNARTVANNNSSRFGKFILVQFKENGAYHGASIEKYLLEKSRIISQSPGERNYHVFYYLLTGADSDLKRKLRLLDINEYNYLTQGSSLVPENGVEEYHRLLQSLSMLRFSSDVQMGMFTVISAILQLGNVTIEKRESEEAEIAQVQNIEAVEIIASLLQVDKDTLESALTTRTSRAGGTDCFVRPYRVEQAIAARDSMAKALYGALFDWIVDKVNMTLSLEGAKITHKGNSIGVLDIFGFEVFQKNSFEQFCINYANEQLQQYFNKHIFQLEQVEYLSEGIVWSSVNFVDNQECLDLIAKKPIGLLPLLDEECSFPGADDNSLFQKFERQHKGNTYYSSPQLKLKDPQFTITHYASNVTYSIKGFREKNRDLMRQDIVDVLKTSHMDLVRALIGQPPYAVRCWRMAHLKIMALFAFRKAGKDKQNNLPMAFKLRVSSSPLMIPHSSRNMPDGSVGSSSGSSLNASLFGSGQVVCTDKHSEDAFHLIHGHLRTGFGLRPSRSYDMLTKIDGEKERFDKEGSVEMLSVSAGSSYSLPYGASPKISRRKIASSNSPPPSKSATLPLKPSSKPKRSKSMKEEEKLLRKSSPKKKDEEKKVSRKSKKVNEGRSRLSSISKIQEKIRKRLSRNIKVKDSPPKRERPSEQYWSCTPKMGSFDNTSDTTLFSLARSSSMRHGPPKTVSAQFQASLVSLMERLEKTNPFFVRCIKSNGKKAPCIFDDDLVLLQLRYTGMMETIKIRRAGYSVRTEFEAFYDKYQFLMGPKSKDLPKQIDTFLCDSGFSSEDFQIGTTKVFMREKQKQELQAELGDKVLARIVKIQRWVRAKMLRCRFLNLRRNAVTIQCAVRTWIAKKRVDALRRTICSAVLIQSAWRSYVARKQLIFLKQAAIILQAHWRGRSSRVAYKIMLQAKKEREAVERKRREEEEEERRREEEKRRLAEEEKKRVAEKEKRRIENEQRKLAEERRKIEEEEKRLAKNEEERVLREEAARKIQEETDEDEIEARELMEEMNDADEQLQLLEEKAGDDDEAESENQGRASLIFPSVRNVQSSQSNPSPLDQDVKDTLFQFDVMVSALEEETMVESTPSPNPPPLNPPPPSHAPISASSASTPSQESEQFYSCEEYTESVPQSQYEISSGIFSGRPSTEDMASITATTTSSTTTTTTSTSSSSIETSELSALRHVAKVKALKQQFTSPLQTPSPPIPVQSHQTKLKRSRVDVKNLIAQMTSSDESDRLTPPPTSPAADDLALIRSSKIVDKITHLTHDSAETKHSRSYKPSTLRRKIVSPFLNQEEEASPPKREEFRTSTVGGKEQEVSPKWEEFQASSSSETGKASLKWEEFPTSSETGKGQGASSKWEEFHTSPERKRLDVSSRKEQEKEDLSPNGEKEVCLQHVRGSLFPGSSSPGPPSPGLPSPGQSPRSPRSAGSAGSSPTSPISSPRPSPKSSPGREVIVDEFSSKWGRRSRTKSSSPAFEGNKELDAVRGPSPVSGTAKNRTISPDPQLSAIEENKLPQYHPRSENLYTVTEGHVEGMSGDTPQPSLEKYSRSPHQSKHTAEHSLGTDKPGAEYPYIVPDTTTKSSPASDYYEGGDDDHLVAIVFPKKKSKKKDSIPKRKVSNPADLDDVLLTFESPVDRNYSYSQGKEGGVDENIHPLRSRHYDHLPPLGMEFKPSSSYQRPRSASDAVTHRTALQHAQGNSSEVVPREYLSDEHRYNSAQRRKRSAVSMAEPYEILKRGGGPLSIEHSSEFTRCLTPDEIVHLNQRRTITSPSERLRLFSFTKRHLKLPFSKSKEKKREKELREKLVSPDKEYTPPLAKSRHSSSPTSSKSPLQEKSSSSRRSPKYRHGLAHNFKQTTASKFGVYVCATCNKGFSGFMKQSLKCVDCDIMVHRYCEERAPACKAHIESGNYVTMSRKKIIRKAEDLDDLGRFLLEKIAVLSHDSSVASVVDKVFKHSLKEFHTFLISTYSLSLQSSSAEKGPDNKEEEPKINLTSSQLVSNFDNIFRGIAKKEGLNDPCHISIGVNQIKTFLDEFGKSRRTRRYSSNINPSSLRRKPNSAKEIQPKIHKGHKFLPQQFKVTTVCEHCSRAIPLLENGQVCGVCGYTCHEACFKKVHKKCEGKSRPKAIPQYQLNPTVESNQFGILLQNLVPPNTIKVPPILENCFHHLEANGLYTQGIYRKSAGVSSKKAVRTSLEEDPEKANLESYNIHAVAAAVGGFFRELPEPLLTKELYLEFLRAMDITNKKEKQETLHKLISRLPDINHAVFERLVFHLARIAQHQHINKMGPTNLAIIFAPCLLQGKVDKNPEEMLRDLQKQTLCIEAIITEQVEKLTATIRGIRTLTSFARETETKLSELMNQQFESSDSTPSSTLKGSLSNTPEPQAQKKKGLTDKERSRLTDTLEEIERERAELTVNLPKLEPFIGGVEEEEEDPGYGDYDRWTPSPSPSPSSPLALSNASVSSRPQRAFSPITESLEQPHQKKHPPSSLPSRDGRISQPDRTMEEEEEDALPDLPVAPTLTSLTKNRVAKRPPIRRPSKTSRREAAIAAGSIDTSAFYTVFNTKEFVSLKEFLSSSDFDNEELSSPDEDKVFIETTV